MICSPMTSKIKDQDNRSNSFELNVSWPQGVNSRGIEIPLEVFLKSHLPGACRQGRLGLSLLSGRSWHVGDEPQWALWDRRPGPSHRRWLSGFQASGERSVSMGPNGQAYQGAPASSDLGTTCRSCQPWGTNPQMLGSVPQTGTSAVPVTVMSQ